MELENLEEACTWDFFFPTPNIDLFYSIYQRKVVIDNHHSFIMQRWRQVAEANDEVERLLSSELIPTEQV